MAIFVSTKWLCDHVNSHYRPPPFYAFNAAIAAIRQRALAKFGQASAACGHVGAPLRPNIRNEHLQYAITWCGLAAVLLFWMRAQRRGRVG